MAGKDNEVTIVMSADISDLKKEIQDAQRHIRLANAEFKAAASGMDDWDKSADGIKAKLEQLGKVLDEQKNILKAYERQLEQVSAEQGENSKGAEDLKIKIENQKAAINKTTKEIEDWQTSLDHVDDEVEEVGDDLEKTTNGGLNAFAVALGNLASNIISDAINKLKDFAKETIDVGKNFDSSMANVAALSGATADDLDRLKETAKEFGSTTKFSASEAADALGYMALAGWDADTSMDALGGVLDLAAASGMDLAEASDMVTDYMSAFNMEAEQSAYFADMMAYAQANANTNVEQLGGAFKNCAANMNAAGQDIETTTSLLAMMANQGLKGEKAGTALSAVMRDITKSMEDGSIAIGDTSVQVTDADGNFRDLTDILRDVEAATQGMGDAEKASALQATFTSDSIKGLNLLLNAGVDDADSFEDALRGCNGTAKDMADVMNDNLGGDLTELSSKLEGVQIAIYEKFEPALRKGVDVLSGMLDGISNLIDHADEIKGFFEKWAPVIIGVATALGTFMLIVQKAAIIAALTKALTAVKAAFVGLGAVLSANPIGIVIALVAGLVAAFVTLWNTSEEFREFWITLWEAIKMMASDAIEALKGFFTGLWEGVQEAVDAAYTFVTELWGKLATWFNTNVIVPVRKFFTQLCDNIKKLFNDTWTAIQNVAKGIANWVNTYVFQPIKKFFEPIIRFFSESFQIIKELGEGCWIAIKTIWSLASAWFNDNVIKPIKQFFTDLWNNIKELASKAWEGVKAIWSAVTAWFKTNIIEPIKKLFADLWDAIKKAASAAWEGIKQIWNVVSKWFTDNIITPVKKIFTDLWEGVSKAASAAWEGVKAVWDKVSKWFTDNIETPIKKTFEGIWNKIKSGASDAWEGIKKVFSVVTDWFKDTFSKAWQAVKDVFSTGGKIFDGIKDGIVSAFKTVVNAIIGGINKVIKIPFEAINGILEKIKKVEIAGVKPFDKLITTLTIPQIPELAKGGVLKRGQLGLLEGNGAEAVVPLENNRKWIAATAQALKVALKTEGVLGVHNGTTNNYSFVQNNTSPKALSRLEIYRQTNNQLQFARGI